MLGRIFEMLGAGNGYGLRSLARLHKPPTRQLDHFSGVTSMVTPRLDYAVREER